MALNWRMAMNSDSKRMWMKCLRVQFLNLPSGTMATTKYLVRTSLHPYAYAFKKKVEFVPVLN
jgi:hypothetical protein